MPSKICNRCNQSKEITKFPSRGNMCSPCCAVRTRARLKIDMYEHLGYSCACCGEKNPAFLSLDHINGLNGRKRSSYEQEYRLAQKLGWPKEQFQILCTNCNQAKFRHGICPHKQGKTPSQFLGEIQALAYDVRTYGDPPLIEKSQTFEQIAESLNVDPKELQKALKNLEEKIQ